MPFYFAWLTTFLIKGHVAKQTCPVMHPPHPPHKEPEENFLPLNQDRYVEFYSLEMDAFSKDIAFYQKNMPNASRVLELGCGTGRISRALSSSHTMFGLDLSHAMLQQAKQNRKLEAGYVCMDMTQMAFQKPFDHIIIPYNTLNLLQSRTRTIDCLRQIHKLLPPRGTLLFQVYIIGKEMHETGDIKRFQFQIFPLPAESGKLIKESIRSFNPEKEAITLEERYRLRPTAPGKAKEDLRHTLHLSGFSFEKWLSILNDAGFNQLSLYGDYDNRPFHAEQDSLLLVQASYS
jgi:ubiquinone/menaquinone biosynthesis C-methylase UbiE